MTQGLQVRHFYLANPIIKSILENNDYKRLRLLHAGAKVLSRQEKGDVHFRVLDEGLESMLTYIDEGQITQGTFDDLKPLLIEQCPFFSKFPEGGFRNAIENHRKHRPCNNWTLF